MQDDTDGEFVAEEPSPSLQVDGGAGCLLAAAAGDVAAAGGKGYSARTQASTVVAYHLIGHGGVDRGALAEELAQLHAGESVYRRPTPGFVHWLDSVVAGGVAASAVPDAEPATRTTSAGIWFAEDPAGLIAATTEIVRLENMDAATVAASVCSTAAVAAASIVMSGQDLVTAAAETGAMAAEGLAQEAYRFSRTEFASTIPTALRRLRSMVGHPYREIAGAALAAGVTPELVAPLAAVVLAADTRRDPVLAIEDAASGGPDAGVVAGAIVGARVGLRRWPWRVPNETWFAEIGRRLVLRSGELRDLPIPYAVEERMHSAAKVDPRAEMG
jgi:hypothetical protein